MSAVCRRRAMTVLVNRGHVGLGACKVRIQPAINGCVVSPTRGKRKFLGKNLVPLNAWRVRGCRVKVIRYSTGARAAKDLLVSLRAVRWSIADTREQRALIKAVEVSPVFTHQIIHVGRLGKDRT